MARINKLGLVCILGGAHMSSSITARSLEIPAKKMIVYPHPTNRIQKTHPGSDFNHNPKHNNRNINMILKRNK